MRGGEEPLLVFFQQRQRPEGCHHRVRQRFESSLRNDHRCLQFPRETVYGHLQTEWEKKLLWLGDKNKMLNYSPKSDEMVLTVHRWFANKSCPGDWLYSRLGDLASKVTAALGGSSSGSATSALYRVRKSWPDAKSQKGAFNNLDNAKKCADSNAGYSVLD